MNQKIILIIFLGAVFFANNSDHLLAKIPPNPSVQKQNQDNPYDLLKQMGFQILREDVPYFELPDLTGQMQNIEQFKGQWIWLAFWATWCGPCAYEMPILESLHQELKDERFKLIGLSIDQGPRQSVEKYISKKQITFPIWHDQSSSVASLYQSSAVPSIYVISPDWKIVGIYRGANNWERPDILINLKKLLPIPSTPELSNSSPRANSTSLQLREDLSPPVVAIKNLPDEFILGQKFTLEIEITWEGDASKYIINIPHLTVPEGIKIGKISSYSQSTGHKATLVYRFPLELNLEGQMNLGPIELSYKPRFGAGNELFSRAPEISITVTRPWWKKESVKVILIILLLSFLALGFFYKKSRSLSKDSKETQVKTTDWGAQYLKVKELKAHESEKKYQIELLKLYIAIENSLGNEGQKYRNFLERIEFGGFNPAIEEVISIEKEIEKKYLSKKDIHF